MPDFKTIPVTQPSLPPLGDFSELLRDIWERKWLTNNGHYHQQFEAALAEYLGVDYISLFCNGTIALQVGLQALRITGEVITTPYSFPATTHAIYWNRCTPVFGDINPENCNLDPDKIESLISPATTCILPVHVYGNPCEVEKLQRIADMHGLKIFYDAAHAFGVKQDDDSILKFGDLSMLSFHATKIFNTIEGGALITDNAEMKQRIDYLKNFGFASETTVVAPGTNGKMNEIQAAYGLLQLEHIDEHIARCRDIATNYRQALAGTPGIRFTDDMPGVTHNYSYFPIFVDAQEYGLSRDEIYFKLRELGINSRRYFYPLITDFPIYRDRPETGAKHLPNATRLANQVICLPIYADLTEADQRKVIAALVKQ